VRRAWVGGLAALTTSLCVTPAPCAPAPAPRALVEGVLDRPLKLEIERAIGVAKTRPQSRVDARRKAREAAETAIAVLRSEGYYDYEVDPAIGEGDAPQAIVRIAPGPRTVLSQAIIKWEGAPPDPESATAAEKALDLPAGSPGRAAGVLAAEGRVVAVLRQRGYADAAIRPRQVVVDHANRSMSPTLIFSSGGLVRLDGVRVAGRSRTKRRWVEKLAPWKPGEIYQPARLAKLEQRLRDTQVFRQVNVTLAADDQTTAGERPVVVTLTDRAPHTIELGGGYATSEGAGVDARWLLYNPLGLADTLTVTARLAQIQQKLDGELDLPDWSKPDQVLKVGADIFGDDTPAYDDVGAATRIDLVHYFTKTTFSTFGANIEAVDTTEEQHINPNALALGQHLKLLIYSTTGALTFDRSNDPLNPTRGWRLQAEADPTYVTGDKVVPFVKLTSQISAYKALDPNSARSLARVIFSTFHPT
jgi:translocation and assembly module TamA